MGRSDPEATEVMQELARFTDPMADAKAHVFVCTHAQEVGHYGRALKCALAHLDAKPGSVDMENRQVLDGLRDTRLACSRHCTTRQRVAFTQLILLNELFVLATHDRTPFLPTER